MNNEMIGQLKRHEGLSLKPYKCSADKLTIGYGRNLEAKGISETEAEYMLCNDVNSAVDSATFIAGYAGLNDARQAVIINMIFQMGANGVSKFVKFLRAVQESNYELASKEMLDSNWAKQTPHRAMELSRQMETGQWDYINNLIGLIIS